MKKKTRADKWNEAISRCEDNLAYLASCGRCGSTAHYSLKALLDRAYKAKETNNRETMNEIYQQLKNWS